MRRRRRRRSKKINFFLISFLLLIVVGVSYAYLSTSLNIKGVITGNFTNDDYIIEPGSNPNLSIDKPSVNKRQKDNIYINQYTFKIRNDGTTSYDNFTISLTFNTEIINVSISNYEHKINGNMVSITNTKYNLKPNKSLNINITLETSTNNLILTKVKLETNTETNEIDPSKFEIVFAPSSNWGEYVYQYNVTLTNKTGVLITYWQINITLPEKTEYQNGWNALFEITDNILIIKNASHNGRLNNNTSTTFGLQLQTDQINFVPTNYEIIVR